LHWNRAYGKRGFVQYQFVLPLNARAGLVEIMNRISDRGPESFLAVLKVLGKQESIISFPKEGYTLALDFPVRPGLLPFLDELDQIVLRWGGRLYLSKDARMKPETLQNGYPGLDKFRDIVRRYNPDNRICSMQSERLFLTGN
jgi:FAD/FMN-containing dehydrogenase